MYRWYRDGQELPVDKADSSSGNGDTYTILSADQSHTGLYTCRGELTTRAVFSVLSHLKLTFYGTIPKPVITQNTPGAEVYTGERVTLSCGFGGDPAGWEYLWYKDTQGAALLNTDSSRTDGSSYTISSAALTHSGEYWCRAARGTHTFYSEYSDSLILKISDLPKAQLTVQSGWTEVSPTERVTLRCEIQGSSTEWMYRWYRDGQELPVDKSDSSSGNGDTYTILSADQSHTGLYTCRGELTERGVQSTISSSVKLKVLKVYTGERVTLSCGFGGDPAGWEYLWFKDTQGAALPNTDSSRTDGSSYTISSAALSHSGEYCCRAVRGRDPFHSNYSDSVVLSIIAGPQAVATVEIGWTGVFTTKFFTSGSVTLRCEVQGISAEWNYTWYRDGEQIPLDHPGDRFTVRAGNGSYQSDYRCRGNRAENQLIPASVMVSCQQNKFTELWRTLVGSVWAWPS
ncbi:hypothetical protein AGOR_G00139930 [Albula goreensis]|uniref:Ig-like domain-containing protein n=1 Tax=Albula goreensis TaxID=1534307 RepID=A0A8T3DBE1_9TELE|nr:hypothetical protein AGOR_G00139930 [Albula goreensis]